jgi:hypothetical protein
MLRASLGGTPQGSWQTPPPEFGPTGVVSAPPSPVRRTHVCSVPGCPNLVPCPTHARPRNARWSPERDPRAQAWFRKQVMFRSGGTCERCRVQPATTAHHDRPGYEPECGRALCDDCHMAVDPKARRSTR